MLLRQQDIQNVSFVHLQGISSLKSIDYDRSGGCYCKIITTADAKLRNNNYVDYYEYLSRGELFTGKENYR